MTPDRPPAVGNGGVGLAEADLVEQVVHAVRGIVERAVWVRFAAAQVLEVVDRAC